MTEEKREDLRDFVKKLSVLVFAILVLVVILIFGLGEPDPEGQMIATYAGIGIDAGSGVSFTLQRGITPSTTTVTLKAGTLLASVPLYGNLVLSDDTTTITIPMWVDGDIERKRNSGGDLLTVTLKDRRWKWKYGYFDGSFNQPDREGLPVSDTDAREILEQIRTYISTPIEESAVTFNMNEAPNTEYPAVQWDSVVPAQAIQEICEMVGLCVVLQTDNVAYLRQLGAGAALPAGAIDEEITTTPAPELPMQITFRGGRIVRERTFDTWEAVGEETEALGSDIKPLAELSYAPGAGTIAEWGEALKSGFADFAEEDKKLAEKCVLKWYRWREDNATLRDLRLPWLPTRAAPIEVKGTAQTANERAAPLVSVSYVEQDEAMFCYVDHVLKPVTDGWSLDQEKGIIQFSDAKYSRSNTGDEGEIDTIIVPAIEVVVAYEEKESLIPLVDFYSRTYGPIAWPGGAAANAGIYMVDMPELVEYEMEDGTPYNRTELDAYVDSIAPLIRQNLWDGLTGAAKTYFGIKDVSPDGAITSVTWHVGRDGAKTEIQRGRDKPPPRIPTYAEYRLELKARRETASSAYQDADLGRKVREGRSESVQARAESRQARLPGRRLGELVVKNVHGTAAPAGAFAERFGKEAATGALQVTRPTEDNLNDAVVIISEIPAGGYGKAREIATGYIKHSGVAPVVGDLVGSISGQWEAEVSTGGTHKVSAVNAASQVFAVPVGVASVNVAPIKITAKMSDTEYTGTVFANGIDAAATEVGATIRVLQIAVGETIPTNTYFMAYKQKWSGAYEWTIDVAREY